MKLKYFLAIIIVISFFNEALATGSTPTIISAKPVGAHMTELLINYSTPSDHEFNKFEYSKIFVENVAGEQANFIQLVSFNTHEFTHNGNLRLIVNNLRANSSYRFSLSLNYKIIVDKGIPLEISTSISSKSDVITTGTDEYGITILAHGFQAFGAESDFMSYAKDIRNRLSGNATIYKNANRRFRNYWEKMEGNGKGEIIFVYEWAPDSWNPLYKGELENAADRLFSMLIDPLTLDGEPIGGAQYKTGTILKSRPIHMISHSRGVIMMLQVLHRFKEYFGNELLIDQFTGLDPHPAAIFEDIRSEFSNKSNLPMVYGSASNCSVQTCSWGNDIRIILPDNVSHGDIIHRIDGNYEEFASDYTVGPFDGVPGEGLHNTILNESRLGPFSGLLGGNHSAVHRWYFGAINDDEEDKSFSIYGGNYKRRTSGYYFSRLRGGNIIDRKTTKTVNKSVLTEQIKNRQDGKPLEQIFNADFRNNLTGWLLEGATAIKTQTHLNITNSFYVDRLGFHFSPQIHLGHQPFYFPNEYNLISFEISKGSLSPGASYKLDWLLNGEVISSTGYACLGDTEGFFNIASKIPEQLKGKVGTFRLVVKSTENESKYFEIKNFKLEKSLITGIKLIEDGYCCESNTSNPFEIQVNANKFLYEPESGLLRVCKEENVSLSTTGCNGRVLWNNKESNTLSELGEGIYEVKCISLEGCVLKRNFNLVFDSETDVLLATAEPEVAYCEGDRIQLKASKSKAGYGKWSPEFVDNNFRVDNPDDPNSTVTLLKSSLANYFGETFLFTWSVQSTCSNVSSVTTETSVLVSTRPNLEAIANVNDTEWVNAAPIYVSYSTDWPLGALIKGMNKKEGLDYSSGGSNNNAFWIGPYFNGSYSFQAYIENAPCPTVRQNFTVLAECPEQDFEWASAVGCD